MSGFRSRENRFASGETLISTSEKGRAKGVFPGVTGRYDIILSFYDAGSSIPGSIELVIGNQTIKHSFNSNIDALSCQTIGENVHVLENSNIEVRGIATDSEVISIDYIDFIPSGSLAFHSKDPERAYVFRNFYKAIYYDDMNTHLSLIKLPFFKAILSLIFLSITN